MNDATRTLLSPILADLQQGRHDEAIAQLRELTSQPDGAPGEAHFLLGSELAQQGVYEEALAAFEAATQLAPHLPIARFQWGLLLWCNDALPAAAAVWAPLHETPCPRFLRDFSLGLLALAQGRLEEGRVVIEHGIGCNHEFPTLNLDLRRVLGLFSAEGAAVA